MANTHRGSLDLQGVAADLAALPPAQQGPVRAALDRFFVRTPTTAPDAGTAAAMATEGFLVLFTADGAERLDPRPGAFDDVRPVERAVVRAIDGALGAGSRAAGSGGGSVDRSVRIGQVMIPGASGMSVLEQMRAYGR